jgi:hypothetical protein
MNIQRFVFIALTLFSGAVAMALEEPEYEVLYESGEVEIRHYDPYIIAEVNVDGSAADREAFGILAGYIFGDNDSGTEMAMTAPVETRGSEYAFVMERKYSMYTLPRPNDSRINLRTKPSRVVAVLEFSGRWTEKNFAKHEKLLLDELAALGIATTGKPELARYNSPFTPWFLRRNEIIVSIDWSTFAAGN